MGRILKYKVPLAYILLENFISISVGIYSWGMLVLSMEEEFKRESAYNFPHNYPYFLIYQNT